MKGPSRGGGAMEFEAYSCSGRGTLTEHDYIGLSSGCATSSCSGGDAGVPDLNESATALRLGPPKAAEEELRRPAAPARNSAILEEFRKVQAMKAQAAAPMYQTPQGPFFSSKGYGVKRGFSEVDVKVQTLMHSPYTTRRPVLDAADSPGKKNEAAMAPAIDPPAPGQTVGWPPVRSFVRNNAPPPPPASATDSQEKEKEMPPSSSSSGAKSLLVKIYMDGVPFGRKVDLNTNNRYEKLFSALEEMFHHFLNAGHYSGSQTSTSSTKSHFVSSSSSNSSSRKHNFLDGSEYVLIYEDHEGDSMLVGDVPWELFVNTVKRLRIMKGSEEVNLAPKNTDPAVKTQPAVC